MRLLLSLSMVVFYVALPAQCYPVRLSDGWGLIDRHGALRPDVRYAAIGAFDAFGYAKVRTAAGVGLIDRTGKEVLPPMYSFVRVLGAQFWWVRSGRRDQLLNARGIKILAADFQRAELIDEDLIAFQQQKRWGVIEAQGRVVVAPDYARIELWEDDFLRIYKGDRQGVVTREGLPLIEAEADRVIWKDGVLLYHTPTGWGGVSRTGATLWPPAFAATQSLGAGYWALRKKNEIYLADTHKNQVVRIGAFDRITLLQEDRFVVAGEGKAGVVDATGTPVLPVQYRSVAAFAPGRYRVLQPSGWGMLGEAGNWQLAPDYQYIAPLKGQVALVRSTGGAGLVNARGEVLLDARYDRIEIGATSARAFLEGAVTTVQYDAAGRLRDHAAFGAYVSVRIGQDEPQSAQPDAPYTLEKFEWFRDGTTAKWGLRDLRTGALHIPPTFDDLEVRRAEGFTLVGIERSTVLTYDRTRFRYGRVYGLVRHSDGLLVTGMRLLDIRWEDFAENPVARCLLDNGRYALVDRAGKFILTDYAYIGPFVDGYARAAEAGQLSATLAETPYDLGYLSDYLECLQAPVRMLDYTAFDQRFERTARLVCPDCTWGYLDTAGKATVPYVYDFVTDPQAGTGLVAINDRWGVRDLRQGVVLPIRFDSLTRFASDLLLVYEAKPHEGLVDTTGTLRVGLRFAEIGPLSEGLMAVRTGNRWGFATAGGRVQIPCTYREVRPFRHGYAAVRDGLHWGYIDRRGRPVIPCRYDAVGTVSDGYFPVQLDGTAYFLNAHGAQRDIGTFERVGSFRYGVAPVRRGGRWGLIDRTGAPVLRPRYVRIDPFDEHGLARVRYGAQQASWGLIDTLGKLLTPVGGYTGIAPFVEGLAAFKYKGKWGFLDTRGRVAIPARYAAVEAFSEGKAAVKRGVHWAYLRRDGSALTAFDFSRCLPFADGRAVVYRHARESGLIDTTGHFILQPELNRLLDFADARGRMRGPDRRYYYITAEAHRYGPDYQRATAYQNGVAAVQRAERWGIIDRQGIPLLDHHYDRIGTFHEGMARVGVQRKVGLYRADGTALLPVEYEYIGDAGGGVLRVVKNGEMGYLTTAGEWVWKPRSVR